MDANFIISLGIIFIIGFFSTLIASGPVTFLALRYALMRHFRKGRLMILGSAFMDMIYVCLAFSLVGVIITKNHSFEIITRAFSITLFLILGVYLLILDKLGKRANTKVEILSNTEKTRSFFMGVILVAINPTVILTWSAVMTALISIGLVEHLGIFEVIVYSILIGISVLCGGLSLIYLIKRYHWWFSENTIKNILRIVGIICLAASVYLLIDSL